MALPTRKDRQRFAVSQWTARAVPIVLTGVAGYATYVLVVILCVNYLLVKQHNKIAAIPILVTYFVLFILMATSFFRTLYITIFDPPYNALGPIPNTLSPGEADGQTNGADGLGGQKYSSGSTARLTPQKDLENPGLEEFYTKDVFRCEPDGAPRWCSTCRNWKKDRTSHCGDIGRCIDKMDHFCPWVGGPIGENNFKFFLQFTTYTALYCTELLVVMAVYIHRQRIDESETVNNQFIAILALAAFFGLFTAGMSITSIGLALRNTTQVETLGMKTKVHTFAVLVPPEEDRIRANPDLASEISFRTVTYPLSATPPAQFNQIPRCIDGTPVSRSNEYLQHVRQSQPIPVAEHERILRRDPSVVNMLIPRDQNAIRTFAILSTETGENPWFLGSSFLNLQALLGTNVLDWLLPIRRSPCCSHEDPESYYAIGPVIDRLRARAGFIAAEDVRPKRPHPRTVKRPREWRNGEDSHRPKGATEMDQLRENVNGHNGRAT